MFLFFRENKLDKPGAMWYIELKVVNPNPNLVECKGMGYKVENRNLGIFKEKLNLTMVCFVIHS